MRWLRSSGRVLEVREVGPVVMRLEANGRAPLPLIDVVESDEEARARLRGLLASGLYERAEI